MRLKVEPEDFVVATGETHTVQEFVELAFNTVGLDWKECVGTDERYMRPSEVDLLLGDATKAREMLGWKPQVSFAELVEIMIESDWNLAREEVALDAHKTAAK